MAWFSGPRNSADSAPPAGAESPENEGALDQRRALVLVASALAVIIALALYRLRDFPFPLNWRGAFVGVLSVLPETGWAAIKVWSFLSVATAILAGLLLKLDPELGTGDAILGGATGLWVGAYVIGQALGPIGLFRAPTIWILLALGAIWLWRRPPRLRFTPPDTGQRLALLTVGLLAVSMLILQLASPVVPFMDVLSYPASAQRIMTFGVYLPFDNDPYGQWGPYAQTPALELLYAAVAMASRSKLAVLAESAMMVPMAALIVFGVYRVGRTLFDSTAGGMAATFLFFTCLFQRAQGMRGTAVDFALVGIGLGFFLDSRRNRVRMAMGALVLGTAVASHAIIGGFAMIVAAGGLIFWLAEGDRTRFVVGMLSLSGATLVAFPELAIGLARPLPYPVLPLMQIGGIALIAGSGAAIAPRPEERRSIAWLNWTVVNVLIGGIIYRHATTHGSIYEQVAGHLPMLMLFAFGGMMALLIIWRREPGAMRYGGLVAFALTLAIADEFLGELLYRITASPSVEMMIWDVSIKSWDYWSPYFLLFPAGLLFALMYERWSKPATIFALLTLLIYPWHPGQNAADYDSDEHSVTQHWGFNLTTAAQGYWATSADRRWTFGPAGFALLDVMNAEIAAGRITPATHVLHIAQSTSPWIFAHFAVFNGVNDDPVEFETPSSTLWQAGSRVREISGLSQALATKPPYVLTQVNSTGLSTLLSSNYEEIFNRGGMTLFRRRDLAERASGKRS